MQTSNISKYLMLLIQKFLHTFLLVVCECSTADLIHEEENCFVPIPQALLSQNPHPKLQHRCCTDMAGLGALHHMTLGDESNPLIYARPTEMLLSAS